MKVLIYEIAIYILSYPTQNQFPCFAARFATLLLLRLLRIVAEMLMLPADEEVGRLVIRHQYQGIDPAK